MRAVSVDDRKEAEGDESASASAASAPAAAEDEESASASAASAPAAAEDEDSSSAAAANAPAAAEDEESSSAAASAPATTDDEESEPLPSVVVERQNVDASAIPESIAPAISGELSVPAGAGAVDRPVTDEVSDSIVVSDSVDDEVAVKTPPPEEAKAEPEAEPEAAAASGATAAELALVEATARDAVRAIADASAAKLLVRQPPAPRRANSKSDLDAHSVEEVAADAGAATTEALSFSEEEEAFFNRGVAESKAAPVPIENFDDLDEDYELPKTFWQRFMSDPRKDRRKK
jgi:hypothetical protein